MPLMLDDLEKTRKRMRAALDETFSKAQDTQQYSTVLTRDLNSWYLDILQLIDESFMEMEQD